MAERFDVTVDGETVVGTHHEGAGERWLFFCHGFLSDRSGSYEARCRRAVAAGYDAVRFDFRGCGDSGGVFVDQGLTDKLADLQAVVDYFDPDAYSLFGSSFGGKVAFHTAAADDRVTAVAARAPVTYNRAFDDYRETVRREGTVTFEDGRAIDAAFFEDFDDYDFDTAADAVDVPVAIFHGRDDESVPIGDSFDAVELLATDTLLEAFADEGHIFTERAEKRLQRRLFDWLS